MFHNTISAFKYADIYKKEDNGEVFMRVNIKCIRTVW